MTVGDHAGTSRLGGDLSDFFLVINYFNNFKQFYQNFIETESCLFFLILKLRVLYLIQIIRTDLYVFTYFYQIIFIRPQNKKV